MERRRKFTHKFKLEGIRLIEDRGMSYVQTSQDFGDSRLVAAQLVKTLADDLRHVFSDHV